MKELIEYRTKELSFDAGKNNAQQLILAGGTRVGLTYGPITSSIDDKKATRRIYSTPTTTSNVSRKKDIGMLTKYS